MPVAQKDTDPSRRMSTIHLAHLHSVAVLRQTWPEPASMPFCSEGVSPMDFSPRPINLHAKLPRLADALEWVATLIEAFAILILILGTLRFLYHFVGAEWRLTSGVDDMEEVATARVVLAHYILTGLEMFIVADLIMLVLTMSMGSLFFLALLVVVRTGISYFLEHEIRALKQRDDG